MKYQFDHAEILNCSMCPCSHDISYYDEPYYYECGINTEDVTEHVAQYTKPESCPLEIDTGFCKTCSTSWR